MLSSFFGFAFDFRCYVSFSFALFDSVFADVFRLGFVVCPVSLIFLWFNYRCCSWLSVQYCVVIAIIQPFHVFLLLLKFVYIFRFRFSF